MNFIPCGPQPNAQRLFKYLRKLCAEYIGTLTLGELQVLHEQLQREWRERQQRLRPEAEHGPGAE